MHTLKGYIICSVTWRVSEVRKDNLRSQEILHWNDVSSAFLSVQSHLSEMLQEAKITQSTRDSNHWKKSWGRNSAKYVNRKDASDENISRSGKWQFIMLHHYFVAGLLVLVASCSVIIWMIHKRDSIYSRFWKYSRTEWYELSYNFQSSPEKCLFICPETRKGVRLKKPLLWIKGSTV